MNRVRIASWLGIPSILTLSLLVSACGDSGGAEPNPPAAEAATIRSFDVTPTALEAPGLVTLSWETADAVSVSLLQDGDEIDLSSASPGAGSVQSFVERRTIFELIAVGEVGEPATERRTVEVAAPISPPEIGSFEAPKEVVADETGFASALLTWSGVKGADSLRIESNTLETIQLDPSRQPSGSEEVSLSQDTRFTLVATNAGGEVEAQAEVKVVPYPIIETFSADRYRVGHGESVEISWTTSGVESLELWVGGERLEDLDPQLFLGSRSLDLVFDTSVELRAYSATGIEVSRSLEVKVGAPLLSLEGSSHSLWLSETLRLEWESEGGNSLSVVAIELDEIICQSFEREEIDDSSCEWEPPVGDHQVSVSVENSSGVASEIWHVNVGSGPIIADFTVAPKEINAGETITAYWGVLPDPDGNEATLLLRDGLGGEHPLSEQAGSVSITMEGPGIYPFSLEASTEHPLSTAAVAAGQAVTVHGLPRVTLTPSTELIDDLEDEVILNWTSEHAVSLVIYRVSEELVDDEEELQELFIVPEGSRAAGSYELPGILSDSTFRIVAINPLGLVDSDEVEVTVVPSGLISLVADRSETEVGDPVGLTWRVRSADSVSFDFGSEGYVVGEMNEPFLDAQAMGGTHLPLVGCAGFPPTGLFQTGCAELPFPEGFRFPFGGEDRWVIRVYQMGFISFDQAEVKAGPVNLGRFPNASFGHVHIAPFPGLHSWNQAMYPKGNIHYLLKEDPSKGRYLVIQWKSVIPDPLMARDARSDFNFEVILWESGDFEYRFGTMDPGPNPAANVINASRRGIAAPGYQTPDRSSSYNVFPGEEGTYLANVENRTFRFTRAPGFETNGSMLWSPIANGSTAETTLKATYGSAEVSRSVSVAMKTRPEIIVGEVPTTPLQQGEAFHLSWTSQGASALQVLDEAGGVVCTAADQLDVDHGICSIYESVEGHYTYVIRATGASGRIAERVVKTTVLSPISIDRFEADKTDVNAGEPITLSWGTTNAVQINVTANGEEVSLPTEANVAQGSITLPGVEADTTFVLRATSVLGSSVQAQVSVRHWSVGLSLTPSQTSVRPGNPVTIQVQGFDLGGGPAPTVYGSFPLTEAPDGPAFADISGLPGAASHEFRLDDDGGSVEIEFPEGFEFPFFQSKYSKAILMADGYLSFDLNAYGKPSNELLPDLSSSGSHRDVHLAPFWDDLKRGTGSLSSVQTAPDSFVIQWKGWSKVIGSSLAEYDLNFQVVLHRDGSFEYRYGEMNSPLGADSDCASESCESEAHGSSATIGYQAPELRTGYTIHEGGGVPYPGGLANKVIRYAPVVGAGGPWSSRRGQRPTTSAWSTAAALPASRSPSRHPSGSPHSPSIRTSSSWVRRPPSDGRPTVEPGSASWIPPAT